MSEREVERRVSDSDHVQEGGELGGGGGGPQERKLKMIRRLLAERGKGREGGRGGGGEGDAKRPLEREFRESAVGNGSEGIRKNRQRWGKVGTGLETGWRGFD